MVVGVFLQLFRRGYSKNMIYLFEFIINPLITAFFTVLGGTIPFGLLLFAYSLKRKRSLLEIAEYQKKYIAQIETLKTTSQNQLNEFIEKIGDFGMIMDKADVSDEDKKALVDFLLNLRGSVTKFEVDIIEAQALISYADKYNFWTVIEDLLHKQYIGQGFLGRK